MTPSSLTPHRVGLLEDFIASLPNVVWVLGGGESWAQAKVQPEQECFVPEAVRNPSILLSSGFDEVVCRLSVMDRRGCA